MLAKIINRWWSDHRNLVTLKVLGSNLGEIHFYKCFISPWVRRRSLHPWCMYMYLEVAGPRTQDSLENIIWGHSFPINIFACQTTQADLEPIVEIFVYAIYTSCFVTENYLAVQGIREPATFHSPTNYSTNRCKMNVAGIQTIIKYCQMCLALNDL